VQHQRNNGRHSAYCRYIGYGYYNLALRKRISFASYGRDPAFCTGRSGILDSSVKDMAEGHRFQELDSSLCLGVAFICASQFHVLN
jgi:hypothetical protein